MLYPHRLRAVLMLVLTFLHAVSAQFTGTTLPAMVRDPTVSRTTLSNGPGGGQRLTYDFYWRVEGAAKETLHVTMLFASDGGFDHPFIGMGFGSTMLDANFVLCHHHPNEVNPNQYQVLIHRHDSVNGYYAPPILPADQLRPVVGISGGMPNATSFFCEWSIPVASVPAAHWGNMIWALNPNPDPNPNLNGDKFTYHNMCDWCRGTGAIKWGAGVYTAGTVKSFAMKQTHGFGMAFVWLLLFPSMVFYGRFFKSRLNWVRVHFIGQSVGAVLVLGFFIVILLNFQAWDQPHAALGMVLLSCLVMQVSLGVANRVRMLRDIGGIARVIKIAHALLGSVMLLAAVAQVALGLNILYPWIEAARGRPIWYTYFALVALWIILFVSTEGFFVTRIRLRKAFAHDRKRRLFTPDQLVEAEAARYSKKYTSGVPLQDMAKKKEDNMGYVGTVAPKVVPEMPLERLEGFQHEKAQETMMRTFTWADIAAEVSGGRLLVIANGKYVYDASVWLYSHPGGSIVLHSVAGTDISFDFFRESGFDADDFKPALPVEPMRHSNLPVQGEGGDNAGRTRAARPLSQPIPVADSQQHSLTQSDWRLILKARRTNVHSFNAIKRLASFMVGTIAADSSPSDEYRRYAITAKTVVSRDGAHSPTYLIRLGLLYPTRESMQEPCFQAGDAVELQVRVGDQVVSRYYTPIGGNPVAFEILVKVKPGGVVSRWLAGQKVGDRQIKVRGPIGRRLLMPPDARRFSLGLGAEVPREIVFFAGGTGISPFLQLVNNLLLPLGATVPVVATYLPQAPDEVELWPGDVVQVYHHYMDGWARGVNLTTGQDGMLPLTFTNPNAGSHFKLILIASAASLSEALGVETLHAALLAYPHQIEVHWAIGHHLAAGSPIRASVIDDGAQFGRHQGSLCGYLYDQPINSELVEYVLADARSRPPPGEALAEVGEGDGMLTRVGSVDRGSGMVVACGPDGYCHRVTEIVKQVDGLRGANIAVMGAERVLVSW